jgi:hypothetical protein
MTVKRQSVSEQKQLSRRSSAEDRQHKKSVSGGKPKIDVWRCRRRCSRRLLLVEREAVKDLLVRTLPTLVLS